MEFLFGVSAAGQYGIDATKKGVDAGIAVYDLFKAVYLDDKKFGNDDLIDLVSMGPVAISKVISAAAVAGNLGKELGDLSEGEKAEIRTLVGSRVNKPGFQKIVKGILEITDGVSEMLNADNPTD